MNLIEIVVSLLAPHTCIVCRHEGSPLCNTCTSATFTALPYSCYRCGKNLNLSTACAGCTSLTALKQVWQGTPYKETARDAIALLKFKRAKAMAPVLTEWLNSSVPRLPPSTIVSHVPTAYARIRLRGYDQSQLIAKLFAKKRQLAYKDTLRRTKATRQVGSSRAERFGQLQNAFTVHKPNRLSGKNILLIDDVLTTGATLESAALALQAAGLKNINAAVIAHAPSRYLG